MRPAPQGMYAMLASGGRNDLSETTLFLDSTQAVRNAKSTKRTGGRFSFEFEKEAAAYLVQVGNTSNFSKPQPTTALDLADAFLLRIELLRTKADLEAGCGLFVFLCDASGRVTGRRKLSLDSTPARLDYPVPAGTASACFAVRISADGAFEELRLRATVFKDQGADGASQPRRAFVLRMRPVEESDRWLDLVPSGLRPAVANDIIAAQQMGIAKLRRYAGSAGDLGESWPSLEGALERMLASFHKEGLVSAIGQAIFDAPEPTAQSRLIEDFATAIEGIDRDAALRSYWFAYAARPGAMKARKLALKMFKSGNISSAANLFRNTAQTSASILGRELQLCARLIGELPEIPARAVPEAPLDGGLAYVAAAAVPYISSGYTVRTHELLASLGRTGVDLRCSVRPGFPWDRSTTVSIEGVVPEHQIIGNVPYYYSGLELEGRYDEVIERTAAELERRFRQWRPRIVQAASNHRNALPALIAARRIGAAFIYEVRGLWELTAATTNPGWEKTERFALERRLELTIAAAADRVLTITRGVADELTGAGIEPGKIELLPNAVDCDLFRPLAKDAELSAQFRLGAFDLCVVYAGALVLYEGLDDLIRAIAVLRDKGLGVRFVVVGDGAFRPSLQELTTSLNLDDRITFVGRVPPTVVPRYWSLADAVVLPRKPFKVCKVVSPLKPFEAMAMSKVVVLSDLPVMREIVRDGETGLLCRSEDPVHIAETLERLIVAPELRARLGEEARNWILRERTWAANSRRLEEIHRRLLGSIAAEPALPRMSLNAIQESSLQVRPAQP